MSNVEEDAIYYARVSSEEETQMNALQKQCEEAEDCIRSKHWHMVSAYIDEGKSGTTTAKRDAYNQLLLDMSKNKFDIIVIKSQDRLMRNVKDWYLFLDTLVQNKKKLYMYLEKKFYTPDDALITGIKAIMAEEYSRDLSKKINNAHRNRQQNGSTYVITNQTWGYDKVDKKVVINKTEAEIVNLIFSLCAEGKGSRVISKTLSNMGVKSRRGTDLAELVIRKIIRNPLYKGTVVMNKRHIDFETKKTLQEPEENWIIHENAVPAIVSPELWKRANAQMDTRAKVIRCTDQGKKVVGHNKGNSTLSSKIICGECGAVYWRRKRKRARDGVVLIEWMCSTYCSRGRKSTNKKKLKLQEVETKGAGCDNISVFENDIITVFAEMIKDLTDGDSEGSIIEQTLVLLRQSLDETSYVAERKNALAGKEKILRQKTVLMDRLLEEVISNADYKERCAVLDRELERVLEIINNIELKESKNECAEKRIERIREVLLDKGIQEAQVVTLLQHTEKIVVFPNHLDITLNFLPMISVDLHRSKMP